MENPTQTLHRLTSMASFDPEHVWDPPVEDPRVLLDLEVNDLTRFPWFFKRYDQSLSRVSLPPQLPSTTAPAVTVLAGGADVVPAEPDLGRLSRLLHLSAGVVRVSRRPYSRAGGPSEFLFRAAGSAGGRFPLEVYVAVPEGTALPAGVHHYNPLEHSLERVGPPPRGGRTTVVVTGIPWRTGWRYRERGYRHVYWDAGTMLSQLLAAAESSGVAAVPYTHFPDEAVAALVGSDGVNEWPVAIVVLGDGPPALEATGAAAPGQVDAAPVEFPLVTAAQRAGERVTLGSAWNRGDPVRVAVAGAKPVETVVLARGSQRRMDPTGQLSDSLLRTCMEVAMRGIRVPHFVAVHGVEGLQPGLYRWPDLARSRRAGTLREELYRLCMDQGLAHDASFVVIAAADISALDDRQYREAQLAAGLVEGRLHLLAYSQGASASGMTFVDGQVPEVLGEPLDGLLITCIGVPEYASVAGGPPGEPTDTRLVTPRNDFL